MPFGPDTSLADLLAAEDAAAVLQRHIPGILETPDFTIFPFVPLGKMLTFNTPLGEAPASLEELWRDLAALPSSPPVRVPQQAPRGPGADYETSDVPRASAKVTGVSGAERWGIAEVVVEGPSHGNPFAEVELDAVFRRPGAEEVRVGGFYDGGGTYRIRFQPSGTGTWTFETRSNARSLDGLTGSVEVLAPSADNRGNVLVEDTYHFAYQDGTPYLPLGTTAYAWTHQTPELQEATLRTLADAPFTKIRMCLFPKSYFFNSNEPSLFPYVRDPGGTFDFSRFDPAFFQHLERRIEQLQHIGVQADLILFHSYDRWGFSTMPAWADDLLVQYVVRRLAAHRNVWWALANEYDFLPHKTEDDWERIAEIIGREDHVGHLTSIHNGVEFYDHTRPWITHCSIQRVDVYRTAENTTQWRERYGKPVVIDECGYEGDIDAIWGNLSARELVRRCWEGAVRGGYVNHGETYDDKDEVLWWAKGGVLRGESAERIGFLARITAEVPSGRIEALPSAPWDVACGGDEDHRIIYLGLGCSTFRWIQLPQDSQWNVDVIDTWNMTVQTQPGVAEGRVRVSLPGREYMAVRLRRVTTRADG
ncbi:DUF5605 domain-containing protein [Streptomyces sp. NPDC003247]|uniref:DUF5605 domain-containing protein n=1 Tax=Streptomyces sp. NPDC003247 TaxID=3364677 RepID=UPI00369FBB85